jgi:hypothetical protein
MGCYENHKSNKTFIIFVRESNHIRLDKLVVIIRPRRLSYPTGPCCNSGRSLDTTRKQPTPHAMLPDMSVRVHSSHKHVTVAATAARDPKLYRGKHIADTKQLSWQQISG